MKLEQSLDIQEQPRNIQRKGIAETICQGVYEHHDA
jgi:hypothetical protein